MRYKKYRSKGLHYKVQTYFDVATSAESMQVLNFSVGGETLRKRCVHLFQAYKYFKLGKLSIKFVPASTLPVDPLGLSYADDDPQTVDPRDQLDCGLVRITNGEDIFDDLTGVTAEAQEGMYQAMLLDPRWYKFGLQSGFKRTAYPLYWQVGQLHQDMFPGATINVPAVQENANYAVETGTVQPLMGPSDEVSNALYARKDGHHSDPRGFFQVGHRGRIGYLPTEAFQPVPIGSGTTIGNTEKPMVSPIPEIRVITAVLPKMRKTNYYYRCYVTEEITFTGLRHFGPPGVLAGSPNEYFYGEVDQFIRPTNVNATSPASAQLQTIAPLQKPPNDGGDE